MKNNKLSTSKWLTSESEISEAETLSLLRSILTADGKGVDFKLKVLSEIESRIRGGESVVTLL
jgi:hypothetical protein